MKRSCIALLLLSVVACGPEGPGSFESFGDPSLGGTSDGGDTGASPIDFCATSALPHDWAENLVDVYVYACDRSGTVITCCAAVFVIPDHVGTMHLETIEGPVPWATAPAFAHGGIFESSLYSNGDPFFGSISLDYCGLPGDELRSFEVVVQDTNIGAVASELIELEFESSACY